jgi:hypothetical protein
VALGAECPVINQLQLDLGAFTFNILGSDFVRLVLTIHTTEFFFGKVICVSMGQPNRCEYVKR